MSIFKNTITGLSRSPSSAGGLNSTIAKKKRDRKLRGLGLLFLALSAGIMLWGGANSNSTSVTASPANDVIVGGIATGTEGLSGEELETKIKQNTIDAVNSVNFTADIYDYYNITEQDILNSELTTINTASSALHSVGRQHFGEVKNEIVHGSTKFYERTINSAYRGKELDVQALVGRRAESGSDGHARYFAIIVSCGNPVLSYDEELSPEITIEKSATPAEGSSVEPGQSITYKIDFRNTGSATAEGFEIKDAIDPLLNVSEAGSGAEITEQEGKQLITWAQINGGELEISESWAQVSFTVKVSEDAEDGDQFCNTATATARDASPSNSNRICHTVVKTPPSTSICRSLSALLEQDNMITLTAKGSAGDNAEQLIIRSGGIDIFKETLVPGQEFELRHQLEGSVGINQFQAVLIEIEGNEITSESCLTEQNIAPNCDEGTEPRDEDCPEERLSYYKTAQNLSAEDKPITSPGSDEPIKAEAGDKIEYTIVYENLGETVVTDIVPQPDDISDLEEYASVIETGGGNRNVYNGITELSWDTLMFTLEPGDRKEIKFLIEINEKGSNCNTPTPENEGGQPNVRSFDCVLENKYGSTTTFVELQPGISKQVQSATDRIPDAGPEVTVLLSIAVLVVASFSYYRTTLITKELDIANKIHRGQK